MDKVEIDVANSILTCLHLSMLSFERRNSKSHEEDDIVSRFLTSVDKSARKKIRKRKAYSGKKCSIRRVI